MKHGSRVAALTLAIASTSGPVAAQISDDVVRIGVIVDMTGVYSANGGRGVVRAVELAVKDFGGKVQGKPIEVVTADYQNKVDVAASKVREWFDVDKIDLVIESTDSAAAISMQKVAADKKKPIIFAGSASTALTNKECSAYGIHWVYDTFALATGTARAVMEEGGTSWYFITADYAFGQSLERDTTNVVQAMGGKILGTSRHPLNAPDLASFLLQAQASKAKVVGLANAGKDTQNSIRQAAEFAITKNQTLATLLMFDTDVKGLGLNAAQGMLFTTGFYWDRNQESRDFSRRFFEIHKAMPTMIQAGAYSATMHYLKAVESQKTDSADVVVKQMRETPVNDFFAANGKIRADGRMVHDMYLAQVKTPAESKNEWDIIKIRRTISGDEAFQPLSASTCPLVSKS
ncbi:ABC transporter substrate-binding protein [Variovorax sp. Sphag1AA]|uniref:ABC transporter substrate-binding protein n=1 Tax=Variovorax sp. Sphag1AA TaxID=2587027 RepID=UPI00160DB87D|nr:ABC transporter substrate-binding protein [Variovorax sp. Sphag1AA]MBB3181053.1 branched-chain amino acid transport system substrate-binding protein [Variovorax sp. Sphag1AA]